MNNKRYSSSNEGLLLGKVPPQDVDLEEAVIKGIILEAQAFDEIINLFTPHAFYKDKNFRIATALVSLKKEGIGIDYMTVAERLRNQGDLEAVGGISALLEVAPMLITSTNIAYHFKFLYEKYIKRELIKIAAQTYQAAFDDTADAFEVKDKLKAAIQEIESPLLALSERSLKSQIDEAVTYLAEAKMNENPITGISTGFRSMDAITNGIRTGKLIVLAARSGSGKTSMVINMAANIVKTKEPVDVYSLETNSLDLILKIIASEFRVSGYNVQRGRVDFKDVGEFQEHFVKHPLSIRDTTNMFVEDLCQTIKLRRKKFGVRIAIIDYLQLLGVRTLGAQATRENIVSHISRSLKATSKDADVAIVALSQLRRAVDDKADKRPALADLRESGNIENDSDQVILLYRPEKHGIHHDSDGYSTKGIAIVDVAKNRNGSVGTVDLLWDESTTSFSDMPKDFRPKFEPNAVAKKRRKKNPTADIPFTDHSEPKKDEDEPF